MEYENKMAEFCICNVYIFGIQIHVVHGHYQLSYIETVKSNAYFMFTKLNIYCTYTERTILLK